MLILFTLSLFFTIFISAVCSLLEAMLLSTNTVDIERFSKKHPKKGELLEKYITEIEETSSAILSLNTIANTLGATIVGGLSVQLWPNDPNILLKISLLITLSILFFSEILPKNIGVIYRPQLLPFLISPLWMVRSLMTPISRLVGAILKSLLKNRKEISDGDEEIILMAEKSAKDGKLTSNESEMISNALTLDDIKINEIMTPKSVIYSLSSKETIGELFSHKSEIPFGRIPIYQNDIDNIIGIVRRRDLLSAKAKDQDSLFINKLSQKPIFINKNSVASDALQLFLKNRQQLAIVINDKNNTVGVIAMEDVIEHIIGEEIFEDDDPAIDMRELARIKAKLN